MEYKPPQLFVDHVDHGRKGELARERSLGQRWVLVGKDLCNSLKLFVCCHFKLIVVVILKYIPAKMTRDDDVRSTVDGLK